MRNVRAHDRHGHFIAYIFGKEKLNDKGESVVTAKYFSPNATIFDRQHADPYSNETIFHQQTLLAVL